MCWPSFAPGSMTASECTARCPGFVVQIRGPADPRSRQTRALGPWPRGRQREAGRRCRDHEEADPQERRAWPWRTCGDPAKADSQIYVTRSRTGRISTAATRCSARSSKATTCPPRCRSATSSRGFTSGRKATRWSAAPRTATTCASSSYRWTNSGGYSPSSGSPSCCLIIVALATDLAEK